MNNGILQKFEELLGKYFNSEKPREIGLPSASYCAEQLNQSANYFGDLIKKGTGKPAPEHILGKINEHCQRKDI